MTEYFADGGAGDMLESESGSFKRQYAAMAAALFLAYLAVTLPLSVLSLMITREWGLDIAYGGLAVGSTFFSTIVTRKYAGGIVDLRGGKNGFRVGTIFYVAASLLCVMAAWEALPVTARFLFLITGRLTLGVGESFVNTSMVSWMVAMRGPDHSGRVMAVVGMAMLGAFAFGGPAGFYVFSNFGFGALMLAAAALPVIAHALVRNAAPFAPDAAPATESFARVIGRIWRYGAALSLQGVGVSVIGAFLAQMFVSRDWAYAGWGMSSFGIAFVIMRILFGALPDRVGGLPVALASLTLEAAGLYIVWMAGGPVPALAGAALTGAGCSMVYPSLGREVVRITPAALRGVSLGCYAAFQDLAAGVTGPAAGFLADSFGLQQVFLLGAAAATLAFLAVLWMLGSARKAAL